MTKGYCFPNSVSHYNVNRRKTIHKYDWSCNGFLYEHLKMIVSCRCLAVLPEACLERKDGEREREKVFLYAPLQGQELPLSAVNATAALLPSKGPVGFPNGIPLWDERRTLCLSPVSVAITAYKKWSLLYLGRIGLFENLEMSKQPSVIFSTELRTESFILP